MPWTWRYEKADGAVVSGAGLQEAIFANQGDAESWLGENWRELLDSGVEQVSQSGIGAGSETRTAGPCLKLVCCKDRKTEGLGDPARAVRIQQAYPLAFFDQHLRGRRGHLLDGPSAAFPEVKLIP